eukprot:Hpha_TRINITY_DN16706_c1_g7::TRINITY_DN16706_c1_g7_i1::g.78721::m.78721/K03250/EIF3E, INT6; translation initiation factor 3 subunit E
MAEQQEPVRELSPEEILLRRKHNLLPTVAGYLDKHLVYPLVLYAQREMQDVYSTEELANLELDLLSKTLMVDHYRGKLCDYKGLEEEQVPASVGDKREEVVRMWKKRSTDAKQFLDYFGQDTPEQGEESHRRFEELDSQDAAAEQPEQTEEPEKTKDGKEKAPPKVSLFNKSYLEKEFSITEKHLNALYLWAKLQYDVGLYQNAADYLFYYRRLGPLEWDYSAIWGKLAAEILSQNFVQALESLGYLGKGIAEQEEKLNSAAKPADAFYKDHASIAQARAWFMHWSLFVHFSDTDETGEILYDDGLDRLIEGWSGPAGFIPGWLPEAHKWNSVQEKDRKQTVWLRALQCLCPHLLRYIAAAIIIGMDENGKRRDRDGVAVESGHIKMRTHLKNLIRLVEAEKRYYKDPITEFVEKLCAECDFEGAHQKLQECEAVLEADFFLSKHVQRFLVQGRKMIFENHCKVHSVMDIGMVAAKLNADRDTAERYIVNMIRNASLDAKIDSEANQVILASQGNNIYKQVREKTKVVRDRTDQLIERLQDRRPDAEDEQEVTDPSGRPRPAPRPVLKKAAQRGRRGDYANFFSSR